MTEQVVLFNFAIVCVRSFKTSKQFKKKNGPALSTWHEYWLTAVGLYSSHTLLKYASKKSYRTEGLPSVYLPKTNKHKLLEDGSHG